MSPTEIAAIVGALAWAPPIFSATKAWLQRPTLQVITQPMPEVGYTTLGPILNLRLAFTTKYQDIVITGVRLVLRHESGEETKFSWRAITQRMGQFNYPQMGTVPFEKELNVLALKVSQKDIEERFIKFQAIKFLAEKQALEAIANKKLAWHRQNGNLDPQKFIKSPEMTEIYENARQHFSWKPGRYKLHIEIESPDSFNIEGNSYEFNLNTLHIQELSLNLQKLELSYLYEIDPPSSRTDESKQEVAWNWIYPDMLKSN